MTLTLLPAFFPVRVLLKYCTTSRSVRPERIESSCLTGLDEEKEIVPAFLLALKDTNGGCPGVPVHGGIPIVFTSIHGVVTQFVNV